jgi:C4-dicarboxylate-specific signal transduction histidine kinase
MTQAEVDAQHVALGCVLRAADCTILGDRVQLQQVMLNLITNAVDALSDMPESRRRIVIRTEVADGELAVAVEDSGRGIPAAVRDQVFMPLYTTKGKGMGMGLAICRTIIDVHGGVLTVAEAPEGGTIFRFRVPVLPPPPR